MKAFDDRRTLERHVDAARSDVPSPEELHRALGVLLPSREDAGHSIHTPSPAQASTLARLTVRGLVAVVVAGGAAALALRASPRPIEAGRAPAVRVESTPVPAAERLAPEPASTPPTPVAIPQPEPVAPRRPRAPTARAAVERGASPAVTASAAFPVESAQVPVEPKPAFDAEANLVEAARKALHEDPARALALTVEHERAFPSGLLVIEREALAGRESDRDRDLARFGRKRSHALTRRLRHARRQVDLLDGVRQEPGAGLVPEDLLVDQVLREAQ